MEWSGVRGVECDAGETEEGGKNGAGPLVAFVRSAARRTCQPAPSKASLPASDASSRLHLRAPAVGKAHENRWRRLSARPACQPILRFSFSQA
uniref:Uncharacterized protein n=1 Tax=Oryza glumipatula TaxID=40148 RepID=A0A0E0AAG7_9ORYZ